MIIADRHTGHCRYKEASDITSITIADTVLNISNETFMNCSSLSELDFEENSTIKRIGKNAFRACPIKTVNFPDSLEEISANSFRDCKLLKEIVFSDDSKIKIISNYSFYGCSELVRIKMPSQGKIHIYDKDFDFSDPIPEKDLLLYLKTAKMNEELYKSTIAYKEKEEKKFQRRKYKSGRCYKSASSNDSKNRHYKWYNSK